MPCSRVKAWISSAPTRTPSQVVWTAGGFGQAVDLQPRDAAGFQDANGFAEIREDDFRARNVLEDGVGVDEVEVVGRGMSQRSLPLVWCGWACGMSRSFSARLGDHVVRNIDAVDLAEVTAHGAQETAGSAADFEGAARARRESREAASVRLRVRG